MRVLYIGPNASRYAQENSPGDVAAAKWSYGLLKSLSRSVELCALTHAHERCWPLGKVLWRGWDARLYPNEWSCEAISYPAVYCVRDWWLNVAYPARAHWMLKQGKFDAILFYNCFYPYQSKIMRNAALWGVPSFPIILDGADPRCDGWRRILSDTQYAAGLVFLSYWAKQSYPGALPTLHMDGGTACWNGNLQSKKASNGLFKFVYTGALDRWRGLDFMKEVVSLSAKRCPHVRIVICGKVAEEARRAFLNASNVDFRGFVSEDELAALSLDADAFLNVRDPKVGENILNYPSKLPQYLSWGKPVVSTWIDSCSPDYDAILCAVHENTPEAFVNKMLEVSRWDEKEFARHFDLIKEWYLRNKLWDVQAKRLLEWVAAVARNSRKMMI